MAAAPYITPEGVDLFLRKVLDAGRVTTTDALADLMGSTHLALVRLRKRGGNKQDAIIMAAILAGIGPFEPDKLKGADKLPDLNPAKSSHNLTKPVPKRQETRAEYRARIEAEVRAEIMAEFAAKQPQAAAETEAA